MCIRHNMDLVFINAYTKFYQNSSIVLKILMKNTFLHQSKAITLLFINKFSPFAIPNHSSLISMSMESLKKIGQKLQVKSPETAFLHQSRAINEFCPFAITNHSSLISMSMQSLKKIGQKRLKLESGNEAQMDGQTDRHSKFQNFRRV